MGGKMGKKPEPESPNIYYSCLVDFLYLLLILLGCKDVGYCSGNVPYMLGSKAHLADIQKTTFSACLLSSNFPSSGKIYC